MISQTAPLSIPQGQPPAVQRTEPVASGVRTATWSTLSADTSGVRPAAEAGEARAFDLNGVQVEGEHTLMVSNTTSKGTGGGGQRRRI